jgi:hypothetical protein
LFAGRINKIKISINLENNIVVYTKVRSEKYLKFYIGWIIFHKELKVKHMGRDSVTLMDGKWDEFLLDIKNKNFRWTQGNSGIITEHKCIKILTE